MKKAFIAAMLLLSWTIVSCTAMNSTSLLNDNWGRSFREAKQAQIINPDAGKDVSIHEGMEGKAAIEAYNKRLSSSAVSISTTSDTK